MNVKSVNVGKSKDIVWQNKTIKTGIFKFPVDKIKLGFEDVENDDVVDRKYHGGFDQACYIYSADHYPFWQNLYPNLEWKYGMFGENMTINGLSENNVLIGDVYQIGSAKIQITHPRNPCFKLGVRFNDQGILKHYINNPYPGTYAKVIDKGIVKPNDDMQLVDRLHQSISINQIWDLLYQKPVKKDLLNDVLNLHFISKTLRESLEKRL